MVIIGEQEWQFTGFYEASNRQDRERVLLEVQSLAMDHLNPLLIMGDFNLYGDPTKKEGGTILISLKLIYLIAL